MDKATLFNVSALCASIVSLALATAIAIRQTKISHRANQLPVLLDLLYRQRSIAFRESEQGLWAEIKTYDATLGLTGLPEDIRNRALEIVLFYQHLAYLIAFKIVDRDLAVLPVHNRIRKTWDTLSSFIINERRLGGLGGADYMAEFEYLARSIDEARIRQLSRDLGREVFGINSLDSGIAPQTTNLHAFSLLNHCPCWAARCGSSVMSAHVPVGARSGSRGRARRSSTARPFGHRAAT
jgi:hypothetical protein